MPYGVEGYAIGHGAGEFDDGSYFSGGPVLGNSYFGNPRRVQAHGYEQAGTVGADAEAVRKLA